MADLNNIHSIQDLKDAIAQYLVTPSSQALTAAQLNVFFSKLLELQQVEIDAVGAGFLNATLTSETVPGVKVYNVSAVGVYLNLGATAISQEDLDSGLVQIRNINNQWTKVITPIPLGNYIRKDQINDLLNALITENISALIVNSVLVPVAVVAQTATIVTNMPYSEGDALFVANGGSFFGAYVFAFQNGMVDILSRSVGLKVQIKIQVECPSWFNKVNIVGNLRVTKADGTTTDLSATSSTDLSSTIRELTFERTVLSTDVSYSPYWQNFFNSPVTSDSTFRIKSSTYRYISSSSSTAFSLNLDDKVRGFVLNALNTSGAIIVKRVEINGVVGVNCDFNGNRGIQNAIESIKNASKGKPYVLSIGKGLFQADSIEEFNAVDGVSGFHSFIKTKDYISLVGDSVDDVIIQGFLPDNLGVQYSQYQTVYANSNGIVIAGLTITGQNVRYPVHLDAGATGLSNSKQVFSNVKIFHQGNTGNALAQWPSTSPIGLGVSQGQQVVIENSVIRSNGFSALYVHTNNNFNAPSKVTARNTTFITNAADKIIGRIQSLRSKQADEVILEGCTFVGGYIFQCTDAPYPAVVQSEHEFNHAEIRIKGFGNTPIKVVNIYSGTVLKLKSKSVSAAAEIHVNGTTTAFPALFQDKDFGRNGESKRISDVLYYYGYDVKEQTGVNPYVHGRLDIGEEPHIYGGYVKSMGIRLGNCSVTNKILGVSVDGTYYTITFNKDYQGAANRANVTAPAAFTNAQIIAEINAIIGSVATIEQYIVGNNYFPEFTDSLKYGFASTPIFAKAAVVLEGGKIRLATSTDSKIDGIALEDAPTDGIIKYVCNTLLSTVETDRFSIIQDTYLPIAAGDKLGVSGTPGKLSKFAAIKLFAASDANVLLITGPSTAYDIANKPVVDAYATVVAANAAIKNEINPSTGKNRRDGTRVDIGTTGNYVSHWWKGGFADLNLVPILESFNVFDATAIGSNGTGTLAEIAVLRAAIKNLKISGSNPAKFYSITAIAKNKSTSSKWQVLIFESDNAAGLNSVPCLIFQTNIDPNTGKPETHKLIYSGGTAGLAGYVSVDWSKLPDASTYSSMYANLYPLSALVFDATGSTFSDIYELKQQETSLSVDINLNKDQIAILKASTDVPELFDVSAQGSSGAGQALLSTLKSAISKLKIIGSDSTKFYSITALARNRTATFKWQVVIFRSDNASGLNGIPCLAFQTNTDPNTGATQKITLTSLVTGLTGIIWIDWSKILDGANYSGMYAVNYKLSDYVFKPEIGLALSNDFTGGIDKAASAELVKLVYSKSINRAAILWNDAFTSTDWVKVNWVVNASGYMETSTTGVANLLTLNRQYSAEGRFARSIVKLVAGSIAVFRAHGKENNPTRIYLELYLNTTTGKFYLGDGSGTNTAVSSQIDWVFDASHDYMVEVTRVRNTVTAKVKDMLTAQVWTLVMSQTQITALSYLHINDAYDFYLYAGTSFIIKSFKVSIKKATIWDGGDSMTEGAGLTEEPGVAVRFADLINAQVIGGGIVSGRSSGTIVGLLERVNTELAFILSDYAFLTIGTNSGNTVANLTQLVQAVKALGCVPILNRITRLSNGLDVPINAMIATVVASENIASCRFDIATSINYDVAQGQNLALFQADATHLNKAGALEVFKRTLVDCPFIYG
jgi:lysophospholipase L1-like esterase